MNLSSYYKQIGGFKHYQNCRFCFSNNFTKVIDLGLVPLAGGFIKKNKYNNLIREEKFYPLEIFFCQNCFLLQTANVIDQDILFTDYFYHSSSIKTLVDHFHKFVDETFHILDKPEKSFLVEIGCNDASLIKAALKKGINAIGVDPAQNIVNPLIRKGIPIMNEYFTEQTSVKIIKKYEKADIIFSSNTLAHIEDMHTVFKGIKKLLKKDGRLVFEVHYLGDLIRDFQYDMIYHEHQYYYSLLTLQKFLDTFNLKIYDISHIPIHAGSVRYYVKHKTYAKYPVTDRVKKLKKQEIEGGLHKLKTFTIFNKRIMKTKKNLLKLLNTLKNDNKKIAGYGASGRGTIMMNYCGLDTNYLEYVIDDAPAKQGSFTPGTHLEIKNSKILYERNKPDYTLLFAWSFVEEIKRRNSEYLKKGGKFIIPLPEVQIISL